MRIAIAWGFATFLLSPASDNWFFAGGGRHWPFFLKIDDARVMFWRDARDAVTSQTITTALALAVLSSLIGLRAGKFLKALRR